MHAINNTKAAMHAINVANAIIAEAVNKNSHVANKVPKQAQ